MASRIDDAARCVVYISDLGLAPVHVTHFARNRDSILPTTTLETTQRQSVWMYSNMSISRYRRQLNIGLDRFANSFLH